jgi:hypothetical protein
LCFGMLSSKYGQARRRPWPAAGGPALRSYNLIRLSASARRAGKVRNLPLTTEFDMTLDVFMPLISYRDAPPPPHEYIVAPCDALYLVGNLVRELLL